MLPEEAVHMQNKLKLKKKNNYPLICTTSGSCKFAQRKINERLSVDITRKKELPVTWHVMSNMTTREYNFEKTTSTVFHKLFYAIFKSDSKVANNNSKDTQEG